MRGVIAFVCLGIGACAAHVVPARLPPSSPASLDAPEAAPAPVTTAARSDPPMPGEDAQGWPGLRGPVSGGHQHHHGHHGSMGSDAGAIAEDAAAAQDAAGGHEH